MLIKQLESIIPDYIEYLKEKQLSENTISTYMLSIRKYIEYLDRKCTNPPNRLENVTEPHVMEYVEYKKGQGSSVHNQDQCFKTIRYFFEYLYHHRKTMRVLILQNIAGFVLHRDKFDRDYGYFTREELIQILETAKVRYEETQTYIYFRDYLIMVMFCYSGLTLSELENLDDGDIDFENDKITIRGVKNKSLPRSIHMSKFIKLTMGEYLALKKAYADLPYLFVSREKNRLAKKSIQNIVKEIMISAGIESDSSRRLSPKTIRHTFIKTLIEEEVELAVICNIMGLELKTLHKYIEKFTTVPDLKEEKILEDHPILEFPNKKSLENYKITYDH